MGDIKEVFGCR